jgi:tetratricopeptide (TPR) repeat protein
MRAILLALFITASVHFTTAQNEIVNAFSASYKFESFKQYDEAVKALKTVYEVNSYEINIRLGWLNYLKGEYTESEKHYNQALAIQGKSIEALLGITYPQVAMLNWANLTATYSKILALDPVNKTANFRLGQIFYNKKEFQKASNYLEIVCQNYPFDFDANVLMAQIKTKQGKISESKKFYKKALLYNPDSVVILKALVQLQ